MLSVRRELQERLDEWSDRLEWTGSFEPPAWHEDLTDCWWQVQSALHPIPEPGQPHAVAHVDEKHLRRVQRLGDDLCKLAISSPSVAPTASIDVPVHAIVYNRVVTGSLFVALVPGPLTDTATAAQILRSPTLTTWKAVMKQRELFPGTSTLEQFYHNYKKHVGKHHRHGCKQPWGKTWPKTARAERRKGVLTALDHAFLYCRQQDQCINCFK